MRVMLTADLDRALHDAASRSTMSASEYCRRAILTTVAQINAPNSMQHPVAMESSF